VGKRKKEVNNMEMDKKRIIEPLKIDETISSVENVVDDVDVSVDFNIVDEELDDVTEVPDESDGINPINIQNVVIAQIVQEQVANKLFLESYKRSRDTFVEGYL